MSRVREALRTVRAGGRIACSPDRHHLGDWLRSRVDSDYLVRRRQPWLTYPATDLVRTYLAGRPAARVFEFGSGGSTLFWLDQGASVVSVEHDPGWHARLSRLLPASVDHRLVEPTRPAISDDIAEPDGFASDDPAYSGMSFESYVRQADEFPDAAFDIVLIDGRARTSCLARSLRLVRSGGLLILDDADRPYYSERVTGLDEFERRICEGYSPGLVEPGRTDVFTRR